MSIRKYADSIWDYVEDTLRLRHIDCTVNNLIREASVATIAAPPHSGLGDVLKLAQKHGIATSENQKSRLTIIPKDPHSGQCPKDSIRVLLQPIGKKYERILKKLSPSKAQQARSCYQKFVENLDGFDIILDEGETARKTLLTLAHKIHLFQNLREMQRRPVPKGADQMNCFIIWGHGLKYKNEILTMISQHFQIITVQDMRIQNITRFIRDVYIEETLKIGYHIAKKNKHLLKHEKRASLVFARNEENSRDLDCHGHGPDKRICSSMEEHLKQVIRDMYNPRKAEGVRSEHHVIHGTHLPLQIENILRAFGLEPLEYWVGKGQDV